MTALARRGTIDKPAYGDPCNGCGLCCRAELCPAGYAIFGGVLRRECPAIEMDGQRAVCGLVAHPMAYRMAKTLQHGVAAMSSAALAMIGSGTGCDARFAGEPGNEEFAASLLKRLREKRKAAKEARKLWGIAE